MSNSLLRKMIGLIQKPKEIDLRDLRDPQQLGEALRVLREQQPEASVTSLADQLDLFAKDDADIASIIQSRLSVNGNVRN